jgi:hypothetical protein
MPASPDSPWSPHRHWTISSVPNPAKRPAERDGRFVRAGAAAKKAHAARLCAACTRPRLVRCRLRFSGAVPESRAATAIAQSAALFGAFVQPRRATK